jgi:hypothetical protein
MKRTVLLFDGHCAACSSLARAVDDLQLSSLTTRSLHDADVAVLLAQAGLAVPNEPAVLVDGGNHMRLLTGFRLRIHMIRLLGLRRGGQIARLAAMEARARRQRQGLSRRRVFRGALGAAVGAAGAAIFGSAQPAAGGPKPGARSTVPADPTVVRTLLDERIVQRAVGSFGPISVDAALEVRGADEPIIALRHPDSATTTFVGMATGKEHVALAIRSLPAADGIEFLRATGEQLGTLRSVDDRAVMRAPDTYEPEQLPPEVICWLACMLEEGVDVNCALACLGCASFPPNPADCAFCTLCAGVPGIRCARDCL